MVSLFRAVPNLTTLNVSSSLELPFHVGGNNVSDFFTTLYMFSHSQTHSLWFPYILRNFILGTFFWNDLLFCFLWFACLLLFQVFGFDRGYWAFQGLDFISRLKKVTIELTYGWNGFELARFMYEHAPNLKNMFVITLPNQASMMRGELWRANRISNARVVFIGKRPRGAPSSSCLSYV
jgi:uncharacterized membrane protein YsdA (DUF1294 family)